MGRAPTFKWVLAYLIHVLFSILHIGLPYMILLLSFAVLFLLPMVARAVPLKYCLVSLSDSCSLRSARIIFGPTQAGSILTVNDFVEGRGGVKFILLRERWLKAVEGCSNGGSNAPKRVRWASIKYETAGTGGDFSGEDFQNIEAFMVLGSTVFAKSSGHKTHLARDAYHAYWEVAWGCQAG